MWKRGVWGVPTVDFGYVIKKPLKNSWAIIQLRFFFYPTSYFCLSKYLNSEYSFGCTTHAQWTLNNVHTPIKDNFSSDLLSRPFLIYFNNIGMPNLYLLANNNCWPNLIRKEDFSLLKCFWLLLDNNMCLIEIKERKV